MQPTLKRLVLLSLCTLCLAGNLAPAVQSGVQTSSQDEANSVEPPARETIQSRLDALTESDSQAAAVYREALGLLDRRALAIDRAAASRESAASAEPMLAEIQAELQKPAESVKPTPPPESTLPELEQALAQATADLERARAEVTELQSVATKRQERLAQIPEAIASARQRRSEIERPTWTGTDPERSALADARGLRSLAEISAIDAEIAALEAELSEYNARRALLPVRRDRAARRVTQAEAKVTAWQTIVRDRRDAEARARAREAEAQRREAGRRHPVLKAFAEETERLATSRTGPDGLPKQIASAVDRKKVARTALDEIRTQYQDVRRRIDASGLTRATGLLLRRHYQALNEGVTDQSRLRRRLADVRRSYEAAVIADIEANDDRDSAGAIDTVVAELLAEIRAAGIGDEEFATLETIARELAESRRDLRGDLLKDTTDYVSALSSLKNELTDLLAAVVAYESYIRERTLWVRSIAVDDGSLVSDVRQTLNEVGDPAAWRALLDATGKAARVHWAIALLATCVVGLLFIIARWAKRRTKVCAGMVGRFRTDAFRYTIETALHTVLLALPVGTALIAIGMLLAAVPLQTPLGIAAGEGLIAGGLMYIALSIVKRVFRTGGLADVHFRWHTSVNKAVRRITHWFVPLASISVAVLVMADGIGTDVVERTLGRLAFATLAAGMFVVTVLLVRPNGPVGQLLQRRGGWAERMRIVWAVLIPAAPLAMFVLPWLGYFYTARQLGDRLESTLAVLGILLIANALLMRWLFIARRRVAVEDARRRREQAIADKKAGAASTAEPMPSEATPVLDEEKVDLPAISQQTQQLFRTGVAVIALLALSAIWADVLPALRMLDRIEVFPRLGIAEAVESDRIPILESVTTARDGASDTGSNSGGTGASSQGNASPGGTQTQGSSGSASSYTGLPMPASGDTSGTGEASESETIVLTLADVGMALILLIATVIAFRNLPGLVEIAVLQRLPLDAGSRYALSTILRYLIAIIGIVAAFGAIDIGWSNVQWLAAAFTFGLAFGLQEIFANFVSGLIILAERPIRIGDTVTVGGVSGTVARIRMRATTISDWDRKELVIPNKNFVTGDIINWTLSDPILRLTIPVGVSYGADVRLAEKVLKRVASETPNVLKDPKWHVYFRGFGDSTLNFELRVFIGHVDHLISVRHELHMRITEAFRADGIEIAFPQRDLHIRSFEGLERLTRGQNE